MEIKGHSIQFSFANPDIAYDFMKLLSIEKIKNPLYNRIKTTLLLDTYNNGDIKKKKENKLNKSVDSKNNTGRKISTLKSNLLINKDKVEKENNHSVVENFYHNQVC